jgi:MinD-like ATPase involved in chromosome partitioning or flagellar assembly
MPNSVVPVLLAAAGEPWEAAALELLARRGSGFTVHRRCVDLTDLLAAAATGMARTALVAADLPGLDADSVAALGRAGVGVVAVLADQADPGAAPRLRRLGVGTVLDAGLVGLAAALRDVGAQTPPPAPGEPADGHAHQPRHARLLAVGGAAGAPGRTTVAVALAGELAHRGARVLLVDADPYGGAVAQHLGVLDGVSGLLSAARTANAGRLDAAALARAARQVGDTSLRVLTGLPRPDRWSEVRPAAFDEVLDVAASMADEVVLDVGFSLESDGADPFGTAPQRNTMTLGALERADRVLVVGTADPVGLARLARGLVDLREARPEADVSVVVNRTRSSLGWPEAELRGMVEDFAGAVPVAFLPDDRAGADRALMAGRGLVELGDCALRRAVAGWVSTLAGPDRTSSSGRSGGDRRRPIRRRRAGTDR